MDTLNYENLKMLAHSRSDIGVSIYMPYNDGATGDLENPTMLATMLGQAENELHKAGVKPAVMSKLFKSAHDLVKNETYWRDKFETLAVFIFKNEFFVFKLPFVYEKTLKISKYPYLKPMLQDYLTNKRVYVLVLSAGGSKLFKFSKYKYIDITPRALHKSSKALANRFQIERATNFHIKRKGGGKKTLEGLISHGHDNTSQLNKLRAEEYARMVAKEVKKVTKNAGPPLIVAGAKSGFMVPTFRSVYGETKLLDDYIQVETSPLDFNKLKSGVLRAIKNLQSEEIDKSLELVSNLFGTGHSEDSPSRVVEMAQRGLVDVLFVNFENDDIANIAAIETWSRGGEVYFVDGSVIGDRAISASLRS